MTFRKRVVLSKDETLQIFNATVEAITESFLRANEGFDYDIVTMMEAFTEGMGDSGIIVRSLNIGANRVGLMKNLEEEISGLANALIQDPDMGGLSYEQIARLNMNLRKKMRVMLWAGKSIK